VSDTPQGGHAPVSDNPNVAHSSTASGSQGGQPQGGQAPGGPPQYVTRDEVRDLFREVLREILPGMGGGPQAPAQGQHAPGQPPPANPNRPPSQGQRPARDVGSPGAPTPPPAGPAQATTPADIVCGKEGNVKVGTGDLPEITKWTFKPAVSTQEYASNHTNGFKRQVCGSRSATGTIDGKWNRPDPITGHFKEGDSVVLQLYIDATRYINCPSIIKSLSIDVDINDNAITGWSADFASDGQYDYFF
jgi:hypothetical protein